MLDNYEEIRNEMDEEIISYAAYQRAFNRKQDNNLWQYNRGFLGENTPASVRSAVRAVIGEGEFSISIWDREKVLYTDEYVDFVEDAIADLR